MTLQIEYSARPAGRELTTTYTTSCSAPHRPVFVSRETQNTTPTHPPHPCFVTSCKKNGSWISLARDICQSNHSLCSSNRLRWQRPTLLLCCTICCTDQLPAATFTTSPTCTVKHYALPSPPSHPPSKENATERILLSLVSPSHTPPASTLHTALARYRTAPKQSAQ